MGSGRFNHSESENRGFETLGSILMAPGPKTIKKFKISKSLFRDFQIGFNKIDHEESEKRAPETLRSTLRDHRPEISKIL